MVRRGSAVRIRDRAPASLHLPVSLPVLIGGPSSRGPHDPDGDGRGPPFRLRWAPSQGEHDATRRVPGAVAQPGARPRPRARRVAGRSGLDRSPAPADRAASSSGAPPGSRWRPTPSGPGDGPSATRLQDERAGGERLARQLVGRRARRRPCRRGRRRGGRRVRPAAAGVDRERHAAYGAAPVRAQVPQAVEDGRRPEPASGARGPRRRAAAGRAGRRRRRRPPRPRRARPASA